MGPLREALAELNVNVAIIINCEDLPTVFVSDQTFFANFSHYLTSNWLI